MNRFRLSWQAEQDLEDIWCYLAKQDELLIFYTKIADGIEIVRVLHQSRDIKTQFL